MNDLYYSISDNLYEMEAIASTEPHYADFRDGDIRHSQADISAIQKKDVNCSHS
ncbi:MAG: hypothetical protein R2827_11055 [Bdellovibrionales bacterium]